MRLRGLRSPRMESIEVANVQTEHGWTKIANQVLESVLTHKFSENQIRVLITIWRFSYGFRKKTAVIEYMKDFLNYGVPPSKIGRILKDLEGKNVIIIDWDNGEVEYQKDYDKWNVEQIPAFDLSRHARLLALNDRNKKTYKLRGWKNRQRGGGKSVAYQKDNARFCLL